VDNPQVVFWRIRSGVLEDSLRERAGSDQTQGYTLRRTRQDPDARASPSSSSTSACIVAFISPVGVDIRHVTAQGFQCERHGRGPASCKRTGAARGGASACGVLDSRTGTFVLHGQGLDENKQPRHLPRGNQREMTKSPFAHALKKKRMRCIVYPLLTSLQSPLGSRGWERKQTFLTKFCRVTEATVKASRGLFSVTIIAAGAVAVRRDTTCQAGAQRARAGILATRSVSPGRKRRQC
jgi:hypothetical protein